MCVTLEVSIERPSSLVSILGKNDLVGTPVRGLSMTCPSLPARSDTCHPRQWASHTPSSLSLEHNRMLTQQGFQPRSALHSPQTSPTTRHTHSQAERGTRHTCLSAPLPRSAPAVIPHLPPKRSGRPEGTCGLTIFLFPHVWKLCTGGSKEPTGQLGWKIPLSIRWPLKH